MRENDYGLTFIQKEAPNGWVVIVGVRLADAVQMVGVVFVPDPTHEWRADEKQECRMKATVLQ
jgi:hypothetical protein